MLCSPSLCGEGARQVKGTRPIRRLLRRRTVVAGSRTGPDAPGHNWERGRPVGLSGPNGSGGPSGPRHRVAGFLDPERAGSGRHGEPDVEPQAIIAQRVRAPLATRLEEDGGSTPHASGKTMRRLGIARESRARRRNDPGGGKRSLIPGPATGTRSWHRPDAGWVSGRWIPRPPRGWPAPDGVKDRRVTEAMTSGEATRRFG